jgi:hypothetical protein
MRILLVTVLSWAIGPTAVALDFYCPRADMTLQSITYREGERTEHLIPFGGFPLHFPRDVDTLKSHAGEMQGINIALDDCSDSKFFCKKVTHKNWEGPSITYFLIVPRKIFRNREYTVNGVRILTRVASTIDGKKNPLGQVTLWQKIGETEIPMELSLQEGRGVIYWDGVRFDVEGSREAEMCILTSETGMFSDVRISW